MDTYNKMRADYLTMLMTEMPCLTPEELNKLGDVLDRCTHAYQISAKEVALSTSVETIPQLVKTYIAVKRTEGLSINSLQNYARVLVHFFQTIMKRPEDVTAADIRMYLYEYSVHRKISDRTLDKYRSFLCWFFAWAYNEEYISKNPAKSIKAIKHEIKERQSLSQLELEYLRKACKTQRDLAVLEVMYSTGCRVSELIQIKKDDVDWKNDTVHLFGKGKKHRTSFLNAKALVALQAYLESRSDDSPYLFVSERAPHHALRKEAIEMMFRKLSKVSGITKPVSPHVIRHTTATQAVNAGMPIEDVSKLLGHASINTTMIYAKPQFARVQAGHLRCVV